MAYVPPDPPVVPYLMVKDGHAALDWYLRAVGGREVVATTWTTGGWATP